MERQISHIVETIITEVKGQCKSHPEMTLNLAKAIIEAVEEKAKSMGLAVVIAVTDKQARPVAVHCMDDSFVASFDIALNKAYTSAGIRMSTKELAIQSQPGGPLYGIQHTNEGRIVIFGGGQPLDIRGKIIGALGVSGSTEPNDSALADYGKDLLKEVVSCL